MKTLLALIPAVVLAGLLAWKWKDAEGARNDRANLTEEVSVLKAKVKSLEVKSEEAVKAAAKAKEVAAAGSAEGAASKDEKKDKKTDTMADVGKAWADMMSTDSGKQMMKEMTKGAVEGMFKDLFDLLNLPEDKKAALTALLSEIQSEQQLMGMKFFTAGSMTDEQKKQLAADLKSFHETSQQKIKDLLGDEAKYKQYQQFEDSAPERQSIGMLRSTLESKGAPLTEQQEQKLMDVLYTQRKNTKWDYDYADQHDANPEKFTPEAISRYQSQAAEYDKTVSSQLNGVLNEDQMQAFATQRTQLRQLEQMGLKMAQTIFAKKE